ncbi:MAG: hypothetical protein ACRCU2_02400 [Planktothrix sp.]
MEYKTEFGRNFAQLQASSQMEIYRNLQALRASYLVLQKNYDELVSHLDHLNDPRESLLKYSHVQKENLNLLIEESSRLFHNFLASAKSLVDHTRAIINRLYSKNEVKKEYKEFKKEYDKKLAADIANHPVQKFVQNLRNYTQHYTLPIPSLQIEFGQDIKMGVRLDVEILKQWDKWDSISRAYLEDLGDSLCLISLSTEYFFLVQGFYQWLTERQAQIHKSDLEYLQKMNDELRF